jgi:hypothetical protein
MILKRNALLLRRRAILHALAMVAAVVIIFWAVNTPSVVGVSASRRELPVYCVQQKEKIAETTSLALMEGFPIPMWNYRDDAVSKIDFTKQPPKPVDPPKKKDDDKPVVQKTYKPIFRQSLLKAARLESDAEIDAYVDKLRDQLKTLLKGSDGIDLK